MTKKSKIIISLFAASITTAAIVTPISYIELNKKQNESNLLFDYKGNKFNSKTKLIEFAKENANTETYDLDENYSWTITNNNNVQALSSPKEAIDFANSKIKKINAQHSYNLKTTENNEIYTSEFQKIYVNDSNKIIKVYRGKNNQTFRSEQEAKDSYFSIHDAYYFDGIYFRTKEELRQFINENIDKYKNNLSNSDIFVIKAPNDSLSRPIRTSNLNDINTKNYVTEFVDNNKINYLEIVDQNNQYNYFNKDDLHNNQAKVLNTISNYSYVKLDTNEGKANYLVDLDKDDEYDLYGPYYTKSNGSIIKMKDPSSWRKIEDGDFKFVDNALEAQVISEFLNSVVVDDTMANEELASKYPFLILGLQDEQKTYFETLKNQYSGVYTRVMEIVQNMRKGKKYNNFYKIPIIFVNLIEELVIQNADQSIIDKTREIFNNVAIKYDEFIKSTIPQDLLGHARNPETIFSVVELFGFYKSNFNLNVDIETYTDIIIQEFPDFYSSIKFTSNLNAFTSRVGNILDMNFNIYQKMFSHMLNPKKLSAYALIWKCINSNSEQELLENVTKIAISNGLSIISATLDTAFMYAQNLFLVLNGKKNFVEKIKEDLKALGIDHSVNNLLNGVSDFYVRQIKRILQTTNNVADQYKQIIENLFSAKLGLSNPINFNLLMTNYIMSMNMLQMLVDTVLTSAFVTYSVIKITIQLVNNVLSNAIFQKFKQIIDVAFDLVDKLSDLLKKIGKLGPILKSLSTLCPYIAVASAVIDLLLNLYKVERNAYVFENEDVKYIWNGGKTEKIFFGIFSNEISGIKDMKLIGPMKINQQHSLNEYYYNGKRYSDLTNLKMDQVNDILNERYTNKQIKNVVSFDKVPSLTLSRPKEIFENVGSLNDDIKSDLVDNVMNNILAKQNYYQNNIYEYAGGFTFDQNISNNDNINNIINKIKPSKVVTLPILKNNYPISRNDKNEDLSVPKYKLPYKSWTPTTGITINNSSTQYLILDPNNTNDYNSNDVMKHFKQQFYNSFDVETKDIIATEFHNKELFSQYSSNIMNSIIYYAENEEGYFKLFTSEASAVEWVLNQYNFKAHTKRIQKIFYSVDNKTFDSLDKYLEYVFSQTTIIRK